MSPTKSTWTAWNRSTWAITSPIEQTFCWTEPKRHLKLESRVKRESNQDAEGCHQLGLVKNRGATTSVGPPFQHPSVLTGSDIFPEGKQDPHLLQLTKLWQVIQFSIQIIKDAMNREKKRIYGFFLSASKTPSQTPAPDQTQSSAAALAPSWGTKDQEPNFERYFSTCSWTQEPQFLFTKNRCRPS